MKTWVQWSIGVGLVALAWGVAALTPPEDAREAPFVVHATIGEPAVGRSIEATITGVQRTDRITAGDWSAEGNWVVVNLTAELVSKEPAAIGLATLTVGDRVFSASERPESFVFTPLAVGIPRSGSLAFELPEDMDAAAATLSLSHKGDTRLDSVIELPIDLGTLPHPPELTLQKTEWTNR